MPSQFLPYLTSLVIGINVTATGIARQSSVTHDQIARFLVKRRVWQRWMLWMVQKLFGVLLEGYLIIDDTVIAKRHARNMEGASFVHSSALDRVVYGYNIVFLCWSNGTITIPISWRWYKKNGKSKIDLAMELLAEAKKRWHVSPRHVFFDTYYSAHQLLNQLHTYGWKFVGQLKSNRIINAAPIKEDLVEEGGTERGWITDTVKVTIIKHDGNWFFTNDLGITPKDIPSLYKNRWPIEEVFRFLKSALSLEKCQARISQAQKTHLASCVLLYLIFQKQQMVEATETLYSLLEKWRIDRRLGRNQIRHYVKVLSA
jgi:hypothetical protein